DRLLAADAMGHKSTIINLSKAMYVMTPFTSLLVLEHEDLYVQYKVDRGRKDHWAMYDCPAKIPVVYEPEPGQPDPRTAGKKPSAQEVARRVVWRTPRRFLKATAAVSSTERARPPPPRLAIDGFTVMSRDGDGLHLAEPPPTDLGVELALQSPALAFRVR